jgi:putative intracellular protease/amidase
MTFIASESMSSMPPQHGKLDWLLVPGGIGSRQEVKNAVMLDYIKRWCDPGAGLGLVMSVCTGSAILAAAGVLDGR